ncbi:MFS transporter [Exilibacterium tricleocarpae]|uniref:MFS transporter n=1 Tax=Exilibacterium tricleocarpae TaxID=2591008 RepID=UPI0015D427CB|nr:MFS transporter [Exilibacterium tricleocarpae]
MTSREAALDKRPVNTGTILAYSSLTIPITAVGVPLGIYLPPLYATELGLGLATVGLVFMLARVFDVITDPLMGLMVDRFPSRLGRRKHWILVGTPILLTAAWFVYLPSPESGSVVYLILWLFVLYLGFTLIDVAHKSWGPDLATTYNDRSRLFGWREAMNICGTIAVLTLPALLSHFKEADAYDKAEIMGLFLIVSLPIAVAIIVRFVPDRFGKASTAPSFDLAEVFQSLRNKAIVRVLIAECFIAVGVGAAGAMFLFVAKWVFNLEDYASLGLIVFFLSGLIAVAGWVKLSALTSKHIALIIASLYSALGTILYLLVDKEESLAALFGLSAVLGAGFTAPQVLVRSMLADIVDQEQLRSGHNRSGLYFSMMSTVFKLGGAMAVGLSYFVLEQVGFDPAVANSPNAVNGLLLTFVGIPSFMSLLTAACMLKYPLTKDVHERIREVL